MQHVAIEQTQKLLTAVILPQTMDNKMASFLSQIHLKMITYFKTAHYKSDNDK